MEKLRPPFDREMDLGSRSCLAIKLVGAYLGLFLLLELKQLMLKISQANDRLDNGLDWSRVEVDGFQYKLLYSIIESLRQSIVIFN